MKTRIPFEFDDAGSPDSERANCTVCSLSIATRISYGTAYRHLQKYGRKPNEGCLPSITNAAYRNSVFGGYTIKMIYGPGRRKSRTLNWFVRNNLLPDRCIVRISGHVFPVIHGVIRGFTHPGVAIKVRTIWEVSR